MPVNLFAVVGASGHTGSAAARHLLEHGQKVRAICRSADHLKGLVQAGAEPFVCSVTDSAALAKVFEEAHAVYVMIPPNLGAADVRAYQDQVAGAIAAALEKAKVSRAVSLSSIGADKADRTGPVLGLHQFEKRLNSVPGLSVLHLRAGYFMENTLAQVGLIKSRGMAAGPLRPDLKIPMIATRDIGAKAAEALLKTDFKGHQTRELHGQRDLTMSEAAKIIGNAIGKPNLNYMQAPDGQVRGALLALGMSSDVVRLLLEMSAAQNNGHMAAQEKRSAENTTPTSFETFVAEEFVPRYQTEAVAV